MDVEKILKALGEPQRYRIFVLLCERRHCVRSLARTLGVSESAVSQHLRVMREAGLVTGEKFGHHTHYMPVTEAVLALRDTFSDLHEKSAQAERSKVVCKCHCQKEETKQ